MTQPLDAEAMRALMDAAARDGNTELDPNDLALLASGTAEPAAEREILERLAMGPRETPRVALACLDAASIPKTDAAPRAPAWRTIAAAAAAILCIVGAAWWLMRGSSDPAPGTDATLIATFEAARAQAPQALADIEPVLAEERTRLPEATLRGGLRIHAPSGLYRGTLPTAAWAPVPGASVYALRLLDESGEVLASAEVRGTTYPWQGDTALPAGRRFTLIVDTRVAGIRHRGSSTFGRLSQEARLRLEQASAALATVAPPALQTLLRAQVLHRLGLSAEARALLAAEPLEGPWRKHLEEMREHLGVASSQSTADE